MTAARQVALVWFRQDLRLADNPALLAAAATGAVIIPVYVWAPGDEGNWAPGAASRWWLHHSLIALDGALRRCGSRLVVRNGPALQVLPEVVASSGATAVYWNRRYEPAAAALSARLKPALRERGIEVHSYGSALMAEPWEIQTAGGTPFRLFTPYHRAFLARIDPPAPTAAPRTLPAPLDWPTSLTIESLRLLPRIPWYAGFEQAWTPGELGAQAALQRLGALLANYRDARDFPGQERTSHLSPHLHFGELSPAQVWHAVGCAERARGVPRGEWRHSKFLTELIWREFAAHSLHHAPLLPEQPFNEKFARLPWREDAQSLRAWQHGRTGVDIVDAGMRQLWHTGWMHNRARMICASFLVKNLLIRWQEGARWFWDTLVDADLANNSLNWQWIAASGPDAAPWFRVFNPLRQAEKFDPDGSYRRRWARQEAPLLPPFDAARSRAAALEAYRSLQPRPPPV